MKKDQKSVVEKYGRLQVRGNKIYDESGDHEVCLAGMSYFWSWISTFEGPPEEHFNGWGDKFYNADTVNELTDEWNCEILRCAVAIEDVIDDQGKVHEVGYISKPEETIKIVCDVIDQCIARGIYVIVDCHTHDAINYTDDIKNLLNDILDEYGNCENILYEIFNEPIGQPWNDIKNYAEEIIPVIREKAPQSIIIVGTPNYSQNVDEAAKDPILTYDNLAYTLHFYSATHLGYTAEEYEDYVNELMGEYTPEEVEEILNQTDRRGVRIRAENALEIGNIALFVTEWGTVKADGNGNVDEDSTNSWMTFLADNKISHLNWSVCDKPEGASALVEGADPHGAWNYDEENGDLTESGKEVRPIILTWQETVKKAKKRTTEKV